MNPLEERIIKLLSERGGMTLANITASFAHLHSLDKIDSILFKLIGERRIVRIEQHDKIYYDLRR